MRPTTSGARATAQRPRRPTARRFGALVALGTTCASMLAVPRVAAQEEPPPAPTTMELVARSDWVDEAPLELDFELRGDLAGATVRVRAHRAMRDAEELATSMEEDVGVIISAPGSTPVEELAVVGDGARRVSFPSEFLGEPGVHPVVVDLVAADGTVVTTTRTPVVRLGPDDDPLIGPELSLLVDVGAPPTVRPDGRDPLDEDDLARFARLTALLADTDVPATLLPVPDTIEALTASDDPRASALLEALDPPGAERAVMAMPYVPTSARSLTDAGLGDVLAPTLEVGAAVAADHFGARVIDTVWPDGDLDEPSAAIVGDAGMTHVLRGPDPIVTDPGDDADVDDRLLEPLGPRPVPFVADDRLAAIVVDQPTATELLEATDDRVDAGHVAVADLLLRDDGRDSDVVLRIDDLPVGAVLDAALPLLLAPDSPTPLVPLEITPPPADSPAIGLRAESEPDLTPIGPSFRVAMDRLAVYGPFVGPDSARTAPLQLRLLTSLGRTVSTDERVALVDSVVLEVRNALEAVALTGQTDLNLTSRRGSLPINVRNGNDHPVDVRIQIRSDRLRFPDGEELQVTLPPGATRIDVPVEALATGSVPTFVQLRTPGGEDLLDARQLNVRSTAFSGVGLALSLGALVVLAVWWARSWRRNR